MSTPILYIIMRNDLDSLNPGKACAQASHATSMFEYDMIGCESDYLLNLHAEWKREAEDGGFGTCIVLEANYNQIENIMKFYDENINFCKEFISNIVVDPTYPIRDGEVTHLIHLCTCAYVFLDKENEDYMFPLEQLELMK